MGGKRAEREARLAEYELPGFAAGTALANLERIVILSDAIRREACEAEATIRHWQELTCERLGYPYRRIVE